MFWPQSGLPTLIRGIKFYLNEKIPIDLIPMGYILRFRRDLPRDIARDVP